MSNHTSETAPKLDRRQFIVAGSSAGLAGLAGCQTVPAVDPGLAETTSHRPRTGYLFALGGVGRADVRQRGAVDAPDTRSAQWPQPA